MGGWDAPAWDAPPLVEEVYAKAQRRMSGASWRSDAVQ